MEKDFLNRKSIMAIVEGKNKKSNNSLILIGHTDTVAVDDYGDLKDLARDPINLAKALENIKMPKDAREDLESGNYLFGRGIFDMKCGVATLVVLIEELSKNVEELEGNVVFLEVCDEEGNSSGMLSCLPKLIELEEKRNYKYLGILDTDYSAPRYPGDENRYIYVGTIGKLMPSFFVVGKETHVGDPYKGLDPNEIASELVSEFNLNMDYCDQANGEVCLPPITLKKQDLKKEYSVQIPRSALVYFNYATHTSTPDQVMEKILRGANDAFQRVIDRLNYQYERYCTASKYPFEKLPWEKKVLSFEDLYNNVREEKGEFLDVEIEKLSKELLRDDTIDEREFALKMVEKVYGLYSNRDPIIVAYFSPPYYPHIYVKGNTEKEKILMDSLREAIENNPTDHNIELRKFYPYISDLSYGAAPSDEILRVLKSNMPGYGSRYTLPLDEMQRLNLPVVNIGPFGKDAHKFTERVELNYSFNTMPYIVLDTIRNMLKDRD